MRSFSPSEASGAVDGFRGTSTASTLALALPVHAGCMLLRLGLDAAVFSEDGHRVDDLPRRVVG